jgi:hypothetical protein
MALKFGRSTPKTTDPITGARIADPDVFGKDLPTGGKVSSWPAVREMFKSGKLKKSFEGYVGNPDVMNYLTGKTDKLSDVEFEEPILDKRQDIDGSYIGLETNYKKGGKNYTALDKQAGTYFGKVEPGTMRVFESSAKLSDVSTSRGGATTIGTDFDTYRKKPDPAPAVDVPKTETPDPAPAVVTEDKPKPPAVVVPKTPKVKAPVVVEKKAFIKPETRIKVNKKVSMNPLAKGATSQGSGKRYLGQVGRAIGSRVGNLLKGNLNKGYKREERLFYDTYGGGETIGKEGFGDMSLGDVKDLKREIRRDSNLSKSDFKEGKSDLNSAIRLKRLEERGKVNFWTEGKGKEYRNSSDYVDSRSAYKSQTANATNQNNITAQQAKLDQGQLGAAAANAAPTSYYTTRGQMKDKYKENNPTASKQEIRKGVRTQIQTNRQTQIDLRKKEKEQGMY